MRLRSLNDKKPVTKALINGCEVAYDAASPNIETPECLKDWPYLGQGVTYSVGGVLQNSDRLMHFWVKPRGDQQRYYKFNKTL